MKKVIVKTKLADHEGFEDKLDRSDLDFSAIYWQHDRIYVPRNYKPNANLPRLIMRTEMRAVDTPPKYSLILRRHITDSGLDLSEETKVTNYVEMVNIILQLGFKQQTEVSRRRQELTTEEGTTIYLDEIDGLDGYYAKIEANLKDGGSVEKLRTDLEKTFASLNETEFVNLPYAEL